MMRASRVPVIGAVLIGVLCLAAPASAQHPPAIAEQIAKTYGLAAFGQIDAIRYTFGIDAGALKLSRSWVWEPKANRVSYDGPDKAGKPVKITYSRSELASQSVFVKDDVDPGFFDESTGSCLRSISSGIPAPQCKMPACRSALPHPPRRTATAAEALKAGIGAKAGSASTTIVMARLSTAESATN